MCRRDLPRCASETYECRARPSESIMAGSWGAQERVIPCGACHRTAPEDTVDSRLMTGDRRATTLLNRQSTDNDEPPRAVRQTGGIIGAECAVAICQGAHRKPNGPGPRKVSWLGAGEPERVIPCGACHRTAPEDTVDSRLMTGDRRSDSPLITRQSSETGGIMPVVSSP